MKLSFIGSLKAFVLPVAIAAAVGLSATAARAQSYEAPYEAPPGQDWVFGEDGSIGLAPEGVDIGQVAGGYIGYSEAAGGSHLVPSVPTEWRIEGTTAAQPVPTTSAQPAPVTTPAAAPVAQQGTLPDILIILDASGQEIDRMEVPSGTNHTEAASQKHGGAFRWLDGGTDGRGGYTARLQKI